MSEKFNDFYVQRIRDLRNELEGISKDHAIPVANDSGRCSHLSSQFGILSCHTVKQIIRSLSSKSCSLDPVPTHILKNYIDAIGPVITVIVNESLTSGEFPSALKRSLIRLVLKKPDPDNDVLNNYRPVANILFLTKVIEKVVAAQTHSYFPENLSMPSMQSAYHKNLSTETAPLRVMNDLLRTEDCRQDVVLVMLDLSAAFDNLDHTILLDRLSRYFGFSHTVLRWFSFYLTDRIQSVTIGNTTSSS